MCHDRVALTPATARPRVTPWTETPQRWGELSADQADGFAPVDDGDLPAPDVSDDRGYGFGV